MKESKLDPHIRIEINKLLLTFVGKLIIEPLKKEGIIIEGVEEKKTFKGVINPYLITSVSSISLFEKFFEDVAGTTNRFSFFDSLIELLKPFFDNLGLTLNNLIEPNPKFPAFTTISIFYQTSKKVLFHFIVDLKPSKAEIQIAIEGIFDLISDYKDNKQSAAKINKVKVQKDGVKYFQYNNSSKKWEVLDPVKEACDKLSLEYRNERDNRIRKPTILLNEDNYNQKFIWDRQWELSIDKIQLIMPQPNDVSIYSKIARENLAKAERFYKEQVKLRTQTHKDPLLKFQEASTFYDYFEVIITAIIFAYTSIEAFANICIPDKYEYREENEKEGKTIIYSKKAIERTWTLSDKLKKALPEILSTATPTSENWWSPFTELEKIRNEIIHTKQTDAKDRYNKLLSPQIFKQVKIHMKVIEWYGTYINQQDTALLNEYPYDRGADGAKPSFITNAEYRKATKN